ncbi:tyrosine-type recombinase/integrase [Micromonospora sp. NPDC049836]|uniref:tyrosine-type recombinase/integrase n=1 Tax=Micromonospora sp. NPDC049836 TaxID=3364274 RepID=UPI00379415A7
MAAQVAGKPRDASVFIAPNGGPLRSTNFRCRVLAAAVGAGRAGLTPHDLRHTAASPAVASRANVKAVQRMLGHASASMSWTCTRACSVTAWTRTPTGWTRR